MKSCWLLSGPTLIGFALSGLAITAALAGCAVQGADFDRANLPPKTAVIYVYRPYNYVGSLVLAPVQCGNELTHIGPGGYHAFVVEPGSVVCTAHSERTDATEIKARAGQEYYVKEEIGWGVFIGHPHLEPVDDDTAHNEIASCKYEQ